MSTSLLNDLNEQQRIAVLHGEGPAVVFAGAGSGKTRVITTRIAHLIQQGVKPWRILAMTFTNKAALEMRQRVEQITGHKKVMVSTFHSSCARWLREFSEELGFTPSFSIYDDKDSSDILKRILSEYANKKELPALVQDMKAMIQWAKTRGLYPNDIANHQPRKSFKIPDGGAQVYRKYQELLAKANAMDFGDLLMNILLLMRRNEAIRTKLQERFQYIMIDEFQDTNGTQFELVQRLASPHNNLLVVGDDDQSIYSWRGAVPGNILEFHRHFPTAVRINLEQNYRCTAHIVDAAAALISHNQKRAEKTLFTANPDGDFITHFNESDNEMEAHTVAQLVKEEVGTYPFKEVAVFYRTNSQSRSLEEFFNQFNIPYTIYGSLAFYDRMEIKDLLAYCKLLINPRDDASFSRIVNVPPRGIGKKAMGDIFLRANQEGLPFYDSAKLLSEEKGYRASKSLREFFGLMDKLQILLTLPLGDVLLVLEDHLQYKKYLEAKFPANHQDKAENIHELGSAMASSLQRNPGLDLGSWLELISLNREESMEQETNGVTMMTLHMAKGLEFDRVYVVGVEDNLIPHKNSLDDKAKIEEERRLLYVGMTRARKKLTLSSARRRLTFNQFSSNEPSRFLYEIPKKHFGLQQQSQPSEELVYHHDDMDMLPSFSEGEKVFHPTYGSGVIRSFEESFGTRKAVVDFFEFGPRKIKPHHLKKGSASV